MHKIWIAVSAMLLAGPGWASTVYKCKSQDGQLQYQSTPCANAEQAVSSWHAQENGEVQTGPNGAAEGGLVLGQGQGGHYFVDGAVNGHYVNFLIDTGATTVTIPLELASAAGLHCQRMAAMQTANGVTQGCMATIQKLTFGHFTLSYVDATIVPNLNQPLLGMNVLKRFHIEQDGQQMRIARKY